jgi:hypothetical protein
MTDATTTVITELMDEQMTEAVELVEVETYASEGNINHMLETLPLMGKGMLGIFLVTLIIVASVAILNKTTGKSKE